MRQTINVFGNTHLLQGVNNWSNEKPEYQYPIFRQ